MAKIPEGILGALIGSLGPVTGKKWKKKSTLSSHRKRAKTDDDPTPRQDNQRSKFGLVSQFHHRSANLVKMTFGELAEERTEFQCAISYNLHNAVSGVKPNYTLHYDRVMVGRGSLPNAVLPEATAGEDKGAIRFTWADNSGIGSAAAGDMAIAVLYCPDNRQWGWCKPGMATRADGTVSFSLPHLGGSAVHTWLTFVTDEGKAADSVYTGMVQVK